MLYQYDAGTTTNVSLEGITDITVWFPLLVLVIIAWGDPHTSSLASLSFPILPCALADLCSLLA